MFYFLFGAIFMLSLVPILDSITGLITVAIEVLKNKCTLKIAKYQKEMMDLEAPTQKPSIIGFSVPTEEEECDYDEED